MILTEIYSKILSMKAHIGQREKHLLGRQKLAVYMYSSLLLLALYLYGSISLTAALNVVATATQLEISMEMIYSALTPSLFIYTRTVSRAIPSSRPPRCGRGGPGASGRHCDGAGR